MTSSNTLKKLVSIGAAMLLAVGGSLVAAQPASAAVPVVATGAGMGPAITGTPEPLGTLTVRTGTWTGSITVETHVWYKCVSATSVVGSGCTAISPNPGGGTIIAGTTTYSPIIGDIGSFIGALVTVGNTSGNATPVWVITTSAVAYPLPIVNISQPAPMITKLGMGMTIASGDTLRIGTGAWLNSPSSWVYQWQVSASCGGTFADITGATAQTFVVTNSESGKCVRAEVWAVNSTGQSLSPVISMTPQMIAGATVPVVAPTTPTPVAEESKPLPVWAAPILKQVPSLSKTLNTDGGKVALTDGDFSSLKSVTIGGKPVVFSTDAKGDVFIPVPAGKAGTSADLVVTFAGGSMVIQDGIKYVAPTDVASVPESTLAGFTKKSTKVTGALAASILYAAQVDHKATSIVCNGYAASKSDVALATARAQAACDYATGAYANLTKATVAVVVNKAKAKSAALGIKVYH